MKGWRTRWIRKAGLFIKTGQKTIEEFIKKGEGEK